MGYNAAVTLVTLESHNHIIGDIERGVKLYERGGVTFFEDSNFSYIADIPEKNEHRRVVLCLTNNGCDIESFFCTKCSGHNDTAVCRHVVAAVLAIQGGVVETKLMIGKAAAVTTIVTESNTAKSVGSGALSVYATPMMIALMEQAACKCLEDALTYDQTSVGTHISVEHTAASPIGDEITASAVIELVLGRKVEFLVTASNHLGEVGKGKHTRVIVDAERFLNKMRARR